MRRVVLVLVLFLLPGCGGPSVNDGVSTATAWLGAVRDRDFKKACGYMDPTAVRGLVQKYGFNGSCGQVVSAYRDHLSDAKLHALLAAPLETTGKVSKDRLGVFPHATRYQFEVVLMRRHDGRWTVAGVGVAPDQNTM